MEIPYIVTPRKDTGLFNSKIAIWLFLASEVMLFGGFFSAYVFLRIGADYPWPERTLPVLPGLINTFVLIFSSITVVFAWASLKLRQWGKFQIYMGITVFCSLIFLGLKGIEYNVKFHHQAVRTMDYTVLEGHLSYQPKDGVHVGHDGVLKDEDIALDHKGSRIEQNVINYETSQVTFNTVRYYKPWVEAMLVRAGETKGAITLSDNLDLRKDKSDAEAKPVLVKADGSTAAVEGGDAPSLSKTEFFAKGSELSLKLLDRVRELHLEARANNASLRTENLRQQWSEAKGANPGKRGWELADQVVIDQAAIASKLLPEQASVGFTVEPAVPFRFRPRDIQEGPTSGTLRDGTALTGKLLESPMVLHYVDALDFRHLAMETRKKVLDADPETQERAIQTAINESWVLAASPQLRAIWEKQQKALGQLRDFLAEKGKVPTEKDKYRIGWQEMAYYMDTDLANVQIEIGKYAMPRQKEMLREEFFGPDYKTRHFPHLEVPREQVQFTSKFAPAWNTYYAIYFTMTGLHGLHVIGGAIVLAYYLFCGKAMYLSNPEWLANRVEVGGLFWHFVDLVWIFLFPILYLM